MSGALLTLCIPTYERAAMLEFLLGRIADQMTPELRGGIEIVVSDNASPDNTATIVAGFAERLPIRYVRLEQNLGPLRNFLNAVTEARTPLVSLCADDDLVELDKLMNLARRVEADEEVGAAFVPIHVMHGTRSGGYFSAQQRAGRIAKGQYAHGLSTILDQHLFPEIGVWRRELWLQFPPLTDSAYFYYLAFATILRDWAILLEPPERSFYIFHHKHPLGPRAREQTGRTDTKSKWDTYRGGLEFLLHTARAAHNLDDADVAVLQAKIAKFVLGRQRAGFDMTVEDGDYTSAYYLAKRIALQRPSAFTPALQEALRIGGAMQQAFVARYGEDAVRKATLVGPYPPAFTALQTRFGRAWTAADPPAPSIGWNAASAPEADLYAEPYLTLFRI